MLGGPPPIYLLAKASGTPPSPEAPQPRPYQRHWTPLHLDFVLDEIDSAMARALSAGARLEQPPLSMNGASSLCCPIPSATGFASSSFSGAATTPSPSNRGLFQTE